MKKGAIVTAVVALFALCAVVAAFAMNASPYVTVKEALTANGDRLHVAGDIDPSTVHIDPIRHVLTFDLKDTTGTVHVIHKGELPSNMAEAKKVVAIGGMEGRDFVSQQLLVKCPSKYEPAKVGQVASR